MSKVEEDDGREGGRLAFHATYTIKEVQRRMWEALQASGMRRSLPRDRTCVLQWAPFTKISWPRVLQGALW